MDAPLPAPEVQRFLDTLVDEPDPGDLLELRRRNDAAGMAVRGALEPVLSAADEVLDGVPVRRYLPAAWTPREEIGLVWVHGGGWFHGDLDVYDNVARALANAVGATVIAVDYRLVPEHRFPAALDDVWRVVRHASAQYPVAIVAGDSSGGNLAAAAAIRARDEGLRLDAQLLIYPVLESEDTTFKRYFRARYTPFAGQPRFGSSSSERIAHIWEEYVPDAALRRTPLATPLRATDLHGVAPAVILTAEHDILRGEDEEYADRLRRDGVPVRLLQFPGQIHGFVQMRGVFAEAATALDAAAEAIHELLPSTHHTQRQGSHHAP